MQIQGRSNSSKLKRNNKKKKKLFGVKPNFDKLVWCVSWGFCFFNLQECAQFVHLTVLKVSEEEESADPKEGLCSLIFRMSLIPEKVLNGSLNTRN